MNPYGKKVSKTFLNIVSSIFVIKVLTDVFKHLLPEAKISKALKKAFSNLKK